MEHFGQARRRLRAVEIARSLGLSPSSANQLLKTMVDSAHLVFDVGDKSYFPSPRLVAFGNWLVDAYGADQGLRRLVTDLQERTQLSVTLTTPNDLFMQIIDLATAPGDTAERGLQISLFGSAIGSAYLSSLADPTIGQLAERARLTKHEAAAVLVGIAQIRADGFADGPSLDGAMWSIALPLPSGDLAYRLVLGIAGRTEVVRPQRDALLGRMRDAVRRWREAQSGHR